MENRARLRVPKKRGLKRGKKHLLRKLVDYLKSDTFMYAPLLSPLPADFPSPDTFASSAKVVELEKPMIEKKLFLEQVGDYMKSDVYMYSPIAGPSYSLQDLLHLNVQKEPQYSYGGQMMLMQVPSMNLKSMEERIRGVVARRRIHGGPIQIKSLFPAAAINDRTEEFLPLFSTAAAVARAAAVVAH